MDPSLKIVTKLPLEVLWGKQGYKNTSRGKSLNAGDIASLLRSGQVQFVVVDIGASPYWIHPSDCYQFWKDEVRPHLATGTSKFSLEEFPDNYFYFASQWNDTTLAAPIIVLEKHH